MCSLSIVDVLPLNPLGMVCVVWLEQTVCLFGVSLNVNLGSINQSTDEDIAFPLTYLYCIDFKILTLK